MILVSSDHISHNMFYSKYCAARQDKGETINKFQLEMNLVPFRY